MEEKRVGENKRRWRAGTFVLLLSITKAHGSWFSLLTGGEIVDHCAIDPHNPTDAGLHAIHIDLLH